MTIAPVTRLQAAGAVTPEEAPEQALDPTYYLHERYSEAERSALLALYYRLKPLMPRPLQLALRRRYARRQAARTFPAWPIESLLVDHQHDQFRASLRKSRAERLPFVNFWPDGKRFAMIFTHDVEGPAGVRNIPQVLDIEHRHGFVSSWNFVARDYPLDDELFEMLRARGCEIGLHGITHDASLFGNRAEFERQLPMIHHYLERWGAVGFRSPATHRNAEWMPELGCLYDTSFPDTDPFEPQAGGCCSIFPYFIGDMVELPFTLTQDHTLFEILQHTSIDLWLEKSEWIIRNHGLVNVLVHPDYLLSQERLALYDELLAFLSGRTDAWHALPREVAQWWRARSLIQAEDLAASESARADGAKLSGHSFRDRATVAHACERNGEIVFEL